MPLAGVAVTDAAGGPFTGPFAAGTTKSVMLCAGTLVVKVLPLRGTSVRRAIVFAEVSCQTWAAAPGTAFARLTVTGVLPDSTFEIAMTVTAPSLVRSAANTERLSAFALERALTLTSPKLDRLPS